MDALPSDHSSAMGDYRAARAKYTKKATCGRKYVLVTKLKLWLESIVSPGKDNRTQASRLLDFAYRKRSPNRPGLPSSEEVFSGGQNGCLLVFCILLELDRGDLIDDFLRQDICDIHLPVDLHSLLRKAVRMGTKNPNALADGFNNLQWQFCPAIFEMRRGRELAADHILPFFKKEKINEKGFSAQLWQIEVPEEFIGPNLVRAVAKDGKYNDPNDDIGPRYNFALKSFEQGKKELFENEIHAFRALRDTPGMVRYLGDYEHVEVHKSSGPQIITPGGAFETGTITTVTSNIILEYGDYDLDEYFMEFAPPVFQIEIKSFWEGLFDVAYAVRGIHNLQVNRGGRTQEFNGWHADIKPDNILIVQGQFKLADPGFTTFLKKKKTETEPKQVLAGGTETYSAPERRLSSSGPMEGAVPQTIDTWSLGCVFSIAATWVVLGHEGVRQFTELRQRAINKIIKQAGHPTAHRHALDFFHNFEEVLPEVKSWHEYLRSVLRKSDIVTSSVLDLVDKEMFVGDASCRIKAADLCERLDRIKSQIQTEATAPPKAIVEILLEVDEAPPRSATTNTIRQPTEAPKTPTIVGKRQAQKSALLGAPLKMTARRSEYLKSELNNPRELNNSSVLNNSRVSIPVSEEYPDIPFIIRPQTPVAQKTVTQKPNARLSLPTPQVNTGQILPLQATEATRRYTIGNSPIVARAQNTTRRPRTTPPQDVFEAREKIKVNLLGKPVKDELMSKHFKDRDIKFLVDNAGSMRPHWSNAKYLLETLLLKVAGQDEDGIDLTFTSGKAEVQHGKSKSEFLKAMKRAEAQPSLQIRTDMKKPLGEIFQIYLNSRKWGNRKLTVIVLTDGKWDGMEDKNGVDAKIITFAKQLDKIGGLEDRPVSIQFIQFGNDPDATSRLRRLDNHLVYSGIPDIVDTEHSTGDVNKMLLGSFVEEYDLYDDDDELTPMSSIAELDAGPITASPYQQPTGYLPSSSNAENGLFQMHNGSPVVPPVQINASTADSQRKQSLRSAHHMYQPR